MNEEDVVWGLFNLLPPAWQVWAVIACQGVVYAASSVWLVKKFAPTEPREGSVWFWVLRVWDWLALNSQRIIDKKKIGQQDLAIKNQQAVIESIAPPKGDSDV